MDNPEHPWWIKSIVVPIVTAVIVGAGGSWMAANAAMARYDERISELEAKVKKRPTDAELTATEERTKAYTDSKFADIMITLTEVNSATKSMREDVREIKQDIRRMESK